MPKVVGFADLQRQSFARAFEGFDDPRIQHAAKIVAEHDVALQDTIVNQQHREDERQQRFDELKTEIEAELTSDNVK